MPPRQGLLVIINFHARLSRPDKDLLDASFGGSFTNKKAEDKWDLLERIQCNTEDLEMDKGNESGIIYDYECIESHGETPIFREFNAKYGHDSVTF